MSPSPPSPAGAAPEPAPGSPNRLRGHRAAATRLVSAAGAVVVHGLLLLGLAAVVWRPAGPAAPRGPEIAIDFEAPASGDAPRPVPGPNTPAARPPTGELTLVIEPPAAAPVALGQRTVLVPHAKRMSERRSTPRRRYKL